MIGEGTGKSKVEELVLYQNEVDDRVDSQRHAEAYRKDRSVVLREDDVGCRARVTTDEERVLYEDIEQR